MEYKRDLSHTQTEPFYPDLQGHDDLLSCLHLLILSSLCLPPFRLYLFNLLGSLGLSVISIRLSTLSSLHLLLNCLYLPLPHLEILPNLRNDPPQCLR